MSIELVKKFAPYTDELFKAESKISLLTNTDYDWTGAHTIAVWKISTVALNDYDRNRDSESSDSIESISRFGKLLDLNAQTEDMMIKKDRSFIFNVDRLDEDETAGQLSAATALSRQIREVVIPEVDKYVYGVMTAGAGHKATPEALSDANIYAKILSGSEKLDNSEVPDTDRVIIVSPNTYTILKRAVEFDKTDVGAELKLLGVIGFIDGMAVIKVPSSRLPEKFGFMIAHPCATVAPVKLEDYGTHNDTPLSSGTIVTGRIVYDAFVLENKKTGIYYYALP